MVWNAKHACKSIVHISFDVHHLCSYPSMIPPSVRTVSCTGNPSRTCWKLSIVIHGALPCSAINSVELRRGSPRSTRVHPLQTVALDRCTIFGDQGVYTPTHNLREVKLHCLISVRILRCVVSRYFPSASQAVVWCSECLRTVWGECCGVHYYCCSPKHGRSWDLPLRHLPTILRTAVR
jgi:hypothetical protein